MGVPTGVSTKSCPGDRPAGGFRPAGRVRLRAAIAVVAATLSALAGCSPDFDWRELPAPGGEYRVQLPGRPAVMTRPIHLEGIPVEMTMQGARVGETSFTVAVVPLPGSGAAGSSAAVVGPDRVVAAMRAQMLRNIGAAPETPAREVEVDLIDADGRRVGRLAMQAVAADGVGRHAGTHLEARFGHWQGRALQAVVAGPPVAAAEVEQFFGSLRLLSLPQAPGGSSGRPVDR